MNGRVIKKNILKINEYQTSLILLISIYIYGFLTFSGIYMDDAYITYRFAKNTAEGFLFTWNIGEAPIEGFSNPLWTLITSLFHLLGLLPIENSTFYFTVLIIGAVLLHLYNYATKQLRISPLLVTLIITFFIFGNYFWHSMFNGLETFLQMAILYFSVYYLTKPLSKTNAIIVGILIVLLILNRFEGFLYAIVIAFSYFIIHYKNINATKHIKYLPLLFLVITLFLVFLFRYLYFGELTPLSVEAKSGGKIKGLVSIWLLLQNKSGWTYLIDFFKTTNLIALIPIFILGFFLKLKKETLFMAIPTIFLFGGASLIAIQNGGDWMPGFRMLSPFALIFVLIFFHIIAELKIKFTTNVIQKSIILLSLIIATYSNLFSTSDKHRFYIDRSYMYKNAKNFAIYMHTMLAKNEVFITAVAGSTPYAANHMLVKDFHGLVHTCVGRDKTLRGNTFGKRKWSCMFKDNYVVQQVNTIGFAKQFAENSNKYGVPFVVAVKNKRLTLSRRGKVTFVRKDHIGTFKQKDPSFEFISFKEYKKLYNF